MGKSIAGIIMDRIADGKDAIEKRLTLASCDESDAVRAAGEVAEKRASALFEALDYLTDEEDAAAARAAHPEGDDRSGDLPFEGDGESEGAAE